MARRYGAEVVDAARRRWPARRRRTSSGCGTRSTALRTTCSRSCARHRRSAAARRSSAPGSASASTATRCAPCARCASTRARCGCATATTSGRCCRRPTGEMPTHSRQTAALPEVLRAGLLAGDRVDADRGRRRDRRASGVVPFFPEGHEGFSIDYPDDFERGRAPRRRASRAAAASRCRLMEAATFAASAPIELRYVAAGRARAHPRARGPRRARGGVRRRLPHQRAVEHHGGGLRAHRHVLQRHGRARLAAPRGARAATTSASPPRATTRPPSTRCSPAWASSTSSCCTGCAGSAGCPGHPDIARGARRAHQHRLARHGRLEGQGLRARRAPSGRRGGACS